MDVYWRYIFMCFMLLLCCDVIYCYRGQNYHVFQKCLQDCQDEFCTFDGHFEEDVQVNPINSLLLWSCSDECKYTCMWGTVEAFKRLSLAVPQFYGKWPFIRILGFQEPASAVFSLLNLYVHIRQYKIFRQRLRTNYPMYWVWTSLWLISINGWIWSTIFHVRDFAITEFMDYASAFAIILSCFYALGMRLLHGKHLLLSVLFTCMCIVFYTSHTMYLFKGRFNYDYNMKANIVVGTLAIVGWVSWCFVHRKTQPYSYAGAAFFLLFGVSTIVFEINDFPPILWLLDPHSLWHLSTIFMHPLFYRFMIEDSIYLKRETDERRKEEELVKLR